MTPPALDADLVFVKLRHMTALLDDLDALPPVSAADLQRDRMLRHALERILTSLVELAAGINAHLAAAHLGSGAATYRESFLLAAQVGALPAELADRLAPSAGLRDVLVHEYAAVDLQQVAEAVVLSRTGYRSYVQAVADWVAR